MGGLCKNSSWINFCQLWLKCVVLDVSDTIVLCFILLLASLAPATINPTMVRQELQVTVARVTVVQSDRHHSSSRALLPTLSVGKAAGGWHKEEESSPGSSQIWFSCCCRRAWDLRHLLSIVLFLPLPWEKKYTSDRNEKMMKMWCM